MADKQELIAEARACICNGVAAYAEAFGIMSPEEMDEGFFEMVEDSLRLVESSVPLMVTLWEIDKKVYPDKTFSEFLMDLFEKRGG